MKFLTFIVFLNCLFCVDDPDQNEPTITAAEPITETEKGKRRLLLNKIRKGVVIIKVKAHVNATKLDSQSWSGTGFIIDRERGLIATNRHVAGSFSICSYELKFSNGSIVSGRRRYVDPFLDFAILEVNPKDIPDECQTLTLSNKTLNINTCVNVMGNAAGDEFSTQEGTIFNTLDILTPFNDKSFHYAGLTVGGASGSPVFDEKGEVVGIVYGGKFTSGTGLPIWYIKGALEYLQKDQIPPRKSIGVSLQYSSTDQLITAGFVTQEFVNKYDQQFPESKGKILNVKNVITGFDGAKLFEPGDIILEVDGKPIGPNLIDLSTTIDKSTSALKFKILRNEAEKEILVTADAIMHGSEDKMISFLGTVWFEHHDQITVSIGSRDKGVYFSGISKTSPLRSEGSNLGSGWEWGSSKIYKLVEIDGELINDLNDLEKLIPRIEKKSMFTLRYIDFYGQEDFLTAFKKVDRNPQEIMVRYEKTFDTAKRFDWDPKSHTWKDTSLGMK